MSVSQEGRRERSPAAGEGDLGVKDYFSQANHVKIFSSDLQFSALKVPEPVDTQSAKIDAQEQEAVSV